MSPTTFQLLIPGPLDQRTGGYLYDARIVAEAERTGVDVRVHSLPGRFPDADDQARTSLDRALASLPDDARVVIDGLAGGGLPDVLERHGARLRIIALVHHPLADETGQSPERIEELLRSEREALRHTRGVVVTSPFTARRLADFGVPADRVRVVEPGTDPAAPAEGPTDGEPHLVCVASLSPRKGHDLLVRALDRLRDFAWRCTCAGSTTRDEPYARAVLESVEQAGLGDRISFPGELDAAGIERVYRSASLFVLPSHYEGYGMAYAEALARGIPVVGTTGGAIPDTVPRFAGVLVPPGDLDALTEAPGGLLGAPSRVETLAEGARMHAASLPGWDQQAVRFLSAVDELAPMDRLLDREASAS